MKGEVLLCAMFTVLLSGTGCDSGMNGANDPLDRYNKGMIHISCDESFKPVIEQEIAVYETEYPDTKIIAHYKPEAECLHDFAVDSIRMVIATRGPSEREKNWVIDSLGVEPVTNVVARDLVAVILNKRATDTFFTLKEIKDLLTGKAKKNLIPVFDGKRATSAVRYMLDSVLKGDSLSENVVAAQSSLEVIDYVTRVQNAVGFVGFCWIGSNDDTAQVSKRQKLKIAYIESTDSANAYVQPAQFFIYTKTYPMVRDLVYVLKERHAGLGHGFARFLESNRGQLIFRRSYLMPVLKPNYIRDVKLTEEVKK
jgi:phosphate transport system substrate-binding protein